MTKRSLALVLVAGLAGATPAAAVIQDADAAVVFLRTDCTVDGAELDNCVETMAELTDATTGWIWNTRSPSPSAASPLLVDVGPGTFGQFFCPAGGGHVSVRGAGREQTVIFDPDEGILANGCEALAFSNLRIESNNLGVLWVGGGSSTWDHVDIASLPPHGLYAVAWYDSNSACIERTLGEATKQK